MNHGNLLWIPFPEQVTTGNMYEDFHHFKLHVPLV